MKYEQIASALNNTLLPNILGEETIIADDLSNIVELGKAIANASAEDFRDYSQEFCARILDIWMDSRIFERHVNNIYRDYAEYGGIVQRVIAGLSEVSDDESKNLQNGVTYNQDIFKSFDFDNKIYTQDCGFMLDWSVPRKKWVTAFSSPVQAAKFVAYITNRAEQTVNANVFATELAVMRQLICINSSDRIKLLKIYNDTYNSGEGATRLTKAQAETDAAFLRWAVQQIMLGYAALRDISALNNDGSVATWCPDEDINITMLTKFASDIKVNMQSDVYHKELVEIGKNNYEELNFWQNRGTQKLPDITNCGEIKQTVGEGASAVTTHIKDVVAVVFDKYSCGMTNFAEEVTSHYNARGNFDNFFRFVGGHRYCDSRLGSIVYTLEDE